MSAIGDMRLAIHAKNAAGFFPRWIEYCRQQRIPHEVVDCYDYRIMDRLREFDGLLWHFHHGSATDLLMARHVLAAAEHMGLAVFPNRATCWHFDDKIAQKYLFESIGAPLVPTYVFYELDEARDWLKRARYPLVWKLRRGAGSTNVRLVADHRQALALCRRAFGRGFNPGMRYFSDVGTKVRNVRDWRAFWQKLQRMPRVYWKRRVARKWMPRERGYALFQEFVPGNATDTRITVVGNRAWGFVRNVRKNDFRASGSGSLERDPGKIRTECVTTAFAIADALGSQCAACDFLIGTNGEPRITEVSYGCGLTMAFGTIGYWDRQLEWHADDLRPEHAIVLDLLASIASRSPLDIRTPVNVGPGAARGEHSHE